jgi:two-component system, cell cycle response regulator DivK
MKILYIEDSEIHAKMMTRIVQAKGHEMIIARTGAEGIALVKKEDEMLDLVFVDVGLPDVDGLSLPKEIESYRPKLPIVAVTALAFEEDEVRSLAAGCAAHLTKPIRVDEVHALLDQFVS